ncbi:tyrosine-type recombinase/integrase [Serratia fonticola]|uniref:tyrosine-type recombinase/integrase n=1 Tax=Serratia fonticola TaxID=47917 RepID=UPI00301BE6B6
MASLNISHDGRGKARHIVHFKHEISGHGRKRIFRSLDEAAEFFYQVENSALGWQTIDASEGRRDWTLQKLIYFFLGFQCSRLNRNAIKLTTYSKCRYDLLAIEGSILKKPITGISTRELELSLRPAAVKRLRSGFSALVKRGLIKTNPINPPKTYPSKPIDIPGKPVVERLLSSDYAVRERIAGWLAAICGLRVGEWLALTYADMSEKYIIINKHRTGYGVQPGLKSGRQRRIRMPDGLWVLLDKSKLGGTAPVLAHAKTGQPLTYAYTYNSPLRDALKELGIKRVHDLRHFAVARLAERGIDIVTVSKLIGHARPSITMDIYGHLFGDVSELKLD